LHDDEVSVAGLALLDEHGAVLEILRFECCGDDHPLDGVHRAQHRNRSLRQRPVFLSQCKKLSRYVVLLLVAQAKLVEQFLGSCGASVETATARPRIV
jgi:hypothetical protein